MSHFFRFLSLVGLYTVIAIASYWVAWRIRFGFYPGLDGIPSRFDQTLLSQALYIIPFKLLCLYALGQFNGLIRYFRMPDAIRLFIGSSIASLTLIVVWVLSSYDYVPPGSVILVDYIVFTFALMGCRVAIRLIDEQKKGLSSKGRKSTKVAIVGAGQAGSSLVSQLFSHPELKMRPVAFFDDAVEKKGRTLHGISVLGRPDAIPEYYRTRDFDKVILAIPSASTERLREITVLLKRNGIPVETVPTVGQLLDGHFDPSRTREVRIEDLLYRDAVQIDLKGIQRRIAGKRVLITGAGGSIGGELARQLGQMSPAQLVLVDKNEGALFLTERMLVEDSSDTSVRSVIADIQNEAALDALFSEFAPEIVFHAAAYKHVGMMEKQPRDAFLNNTVATIRLARKAVATGVESFCQISTDKAVDPSSVMGATKRLAELALLALVALNETGRTRFSIVRFGNVIGSSGSVIPIFERQIAERKPVTVTDPAMTRYFMTIPEAVGLVLQTMAFDEEAGLYVLDMGEPVSIDAMARDLIRLKGFEPDVDIPVVYTGRQPGEKLHERLHFTAETLQPTAHPRIHRIASSADFPGEGTRILEELERLSMPGETSDALRQALFRLSETSEASFG